MIRGRLLLALAAVPCFVLAAVLGPQPAGGIVSVEAAIGRSMGGLRVLLIDVLFLRAESLQSQAPEDGNLEEAAALYGTILELDPANDAAAAYLVDVYAGELMLTAETPEDRFTWWRKAWDLARRALALNPQSARLHVRVAQLLLDVFLPEDMIPAVEREVPDRRRVALHHLLRAAELRRNLPRLGYVHLRILANVAALTAAEAAAAGDAELQAEATDATRWLMEAHGEVLARMGYQVVRGEENEEVLPLDEVTLVGLDAIEAVGAALRGGDADAAARLAARYRALVGDNLLADRLDAWIEALK